MHLLDNFIKEKFLEDIRILLNKYNIPYSIYALGALYRAEVFNHNFRLEVLSLYKKHFHRNLTIAELLATKQDLDTERQVIGLVKNHININNITYRTIHTITLYLSYLDQKVIEIPESIYKNS